MVGSTARCLRPYPTHLPFAPLGPTMATEPVSCWYLVTTEHRPHHTDLVVINRFRVSTKGRGYLNHPTFAWQEYARTNVPARGHCAAALRATRRCRT